MSVAVVLVYGACLALMNVVVVFFYGPLDPRIRYWRRAGRRPARGAPGLEPLPRRVAAPAAQPARGGGRRGGHPALPRRDLRGPDRSAVLHQGQLRPPLRAPEPRVPPRHRPPRPRRALAADL